MTVPVRGIFSAAFSSLLFYFTHLLLPFHTIKRQTQQNIAHRDEGHRTALTSQSLEVIPAAGDWKRAVPSSVLHCTSRNDNVDVLGKVLRRTQSFRIPIRLHVYSYNRTRRLPPEVGADPLACFLHIYQVLRLTIQVWATNQSHCPFRKKSIYETRFWVDMR